MVFFVLSYFLPLSDNLYTGVKNSCLNSLRQNIHNHKTLKLLKTNEIDISIHNVDNIHYRVFSIVYEIDIDNQLVNLNIHNGEVFSHFSLLSLYIFLCVFILYLKKAALCCNSVFIAVTICISYFYNIQYIILYVVYYIIYILYIFFITLCN